MTHLDIHLYKKHATKILRWTYSAMDSRYN